MKYLNSDTLTFEYNFNSKDFEPVSVDTYDETAIMKSINLQNRDQLFACALQFAIIGTGNSSFGRVKVNGTEYNVETLMKSNNVKYGLKTNSKLEPGDLTLRRLARFFRFHISKYIQETGTYSFLYLKYAETGHPEYTFPCAEYFILEDQVEGLLSAYQALDQSLGTRFHSRTSQILRSRRVLKP